MTDEAESGAQRRLRFLQLFLEKMDAEEALALAARMEAFVTTGVETTPRNDDQRRTAPQDAPAQSLAAPTGTIARGLHPGSSAAERPAPAKPARDASGRLLNDAELRSFTDRAVQGATNRDLARLFGLTPRQANGIRMALAKRTPQVALRHA
jgi:hypothetical protein